MAAVVLSTLAFGVPAASAAKSFASWPQYLFSAGHTSDNAAATTITTANAGTVSLAWKFWAKGSPGFVGFNSSPTVYNGVIYIGARNGYFYAIKETSPTTRRVLWSRFIGYVTKTTCGNEGFTSTATVTPDPTSGVPTVYVYSATGYLYAMNAATGADVWPPAEVAIPSSTVNDYYAWSSPLVVDGNIYVGISSECDKPLVRGALDSFSQATGQLQGTFWTTPPGTTGASIWSSPASDGASVYITTGNGSSASLGDSIIKLSPSLAQQDIWTIPKAQQVGDGDFGASPTIWTATINGIPTPLVGACNKNGTFYALQASDLAAGPVWSDKIANRSSQGPGDCVAAAIWDGSRLYLATNGTTINGTAYQGSVMQVDPATGAVIWQTGLGGPVMGTPTMNGSGVIAAATYGATTGQNAVYLLDASTGNVLNTISYGASGIFAQPVFADADLFVASAGSMALRAYTVP